MILNDVQEKLKEIDPNVFYGAVSRKMRETVWDYIVFERKQMDVSTNKTGHTLLFSVHLVREEYIPDGLEKNLVAKILEIPGVRVSGQGGSYDYTTKPNTDQVVEMFSIDFARPYKG